MDRKGVAKAARRARAVESFRAAGDAIGPLSAGMSIFGVTRGQFSMIDMVTYLLGEVDQAAVSIWTWTVASYEVDAMGGLMADRRITSARLVVDYSASQRNRDLLAEWQATFGPGSVRVCKTHAKIARVWGGDGLRFLLRGSMNLNWNPRLEQFDITEGGEDFDLVERIEEDMPVIGLDPSWQQAHAASRLGDSFDVGTLERFGGLPAWKP